MTVEPQAIYDFWFGGPGLDEFGQSRKVWFVKDPAFDEQIRQRFLTTLESAQRGELQHWRQDPKHCLSLIILLDQFPRNVFRDTPGAFATDPMALDTARFAVEQRYDEAVSSLERVFIYLPFEHSESLQDQVRSVTLFKALKEEVSNGAEFLDYAKRHHDVIARFGRFPHRNRILNRASTEAEIEFLLQPGSSF